MKNTMKESSCLCELTREGGSLKKWDLSWDLMLCFSNYAEGLDISLWFNFQPTETNMWCYCVWQYGTPHRVQLVIWAWHHHIVWYPVQWEEPTDHVLWGISSIKLLYKFFFFFLNTSLNFYVLLWTQWGVINVLWPLSESHWVVII